MGIPCNRPLAKRKLSPRVEGYYRHKGCRFHDELYVVRGWTLKMRCVYDATFRSSKKKGSLIKRGRPRYNMCTLMKRNELLEYVIRGITNRLVDEDVALRVESCLRNIVAPAFNLT